MRSYSSRTQNIQNVTPTSTPTNRMWNHSLEASDRKPREVGEEALRNRHSITIDINNSMHGDYSLCWYSWFLLVYGESQQLDMN